MFIEPYEEIFDDFGIWENFRRTGLSFGIDDNLMNVDNARSAEARTPHIQFNYGDNAGSWPFDEVSLQRKMDFLSKAFEGLVPWQLVERLSESEIGSPPRFSYPKPEGSILADPHDLLLVYYARQIGKAWAKSFGPVRILEIGGGYGGLTAKLQNLWPKATVSIVDLPQMGATQIRYLAEACPNSVMVTASELALDPSFPFEPEPRLEFITPNMVQFLPDRSIDIIINTRSFQEMNVDQIKLYFDHIHRLSIPGHTLFYNVNRYHKHHKNDRVLLKRYPYDPNWQVMMSKQALGQPALGEIMTLRLGREYTGNVEEVLSTLPETDASAFSNQARIRDFS